MNERFNLQDGFFFLFLFGLSAAFYKVLAPFMFAIFSAIILVGFFQKPFNFFIKLGMKRSLASFLVVLMTFFLVTIPLVLLSILISVEAAEGFVNFQEKWPEIYKAVAESQFVNDLKSLPLLGNNFINLEEFDFMGKLGQWIGQISEFFIGMASRAFINISSVILQSIVALYVMFFLFLQGDYLMAKIHELLPLKDEDEQEFLTEIRKITNATLLGTVFIGVLEGAFGAFLLWLFGVPSPILWGLLMMVLSMIPLVGTNGILVPVGVFFLLTGNLTAGLVIIILGVGGILLSQNILKPKLVGDRSGLHPVFVVLSTLGGIAWLGLKGFLVGPVVASLFIVIWYQFGRRYKQDLLRWNRPGPG